MGNSSSASQEGSNLEKVSQQLQQENISTPPSSQQEEEISQNIEPEQENSVNSKPTSPKAGVEGLLEDRFEFVIPDWGPIYDRTVLKDYLDRTPEKQEFIDVLNAIANVNEPELEDIDRRQVEVFQKEFKILEKHFSKLVPLYNRDINYWEVDRSTFSPEQRLGAVWNDDFGSTDEDYNVCDAFTDSISRLMDTLDYLMPICQGVKNQSCMNVSQTMLKFEFVLANAASAHCAKMMSTKLIEEQKTEDYA